MSAHRPAPGKARHGAPRRPRGGIVIVLDCPNCGPRDASEFHYVGERRARPDPNTTTPEQWRAFLYLRDNRAGWVSESWLHRAGCRRFLVIERHTVTNDVRDVRSADGAGDAAEGSDG